jgi:hypothetical protein
LAKKKILGEDGRYVFQLKIAAPKAEVRFGSKADFAGRPSHVRFTPEGGPS